MAVEEPVEPMPGYAEFAVKTYWSWTEYYDTHDCNVNWVTKWVDDVSTNGRYENVDIVLLVLLAVLWTVMRIFATRMCFTPLARWLRLNPTSTRKFPESVWKLLFYSFTWSLSVYVVLYSGKYNFFQEPCLVWTDWEVGMEVPRDIYIVLMIQASFYLHSMWGTAFLDARRKDTGIMMFHHVLTFALICFSYTTRYHKIGTVVLLLHDVTDIQLEFTKVNIYLKHRGKNTYSIHQQMSNLGFFLFASAWLVFRLYWYPLKVLYSTGYGAMKYAPVEKKPFFVFLNVMLWILQLLNIYWFSFVLHFLYKLATGQMTEVDDTREYEAGKKHCQELNGNVTNKGAEYSVKADQNGVLHNGLTHQQLHKLD